MFESTFAAQLSETTIYWNGFQILVLATLLTVFIFFKKYFLWRNKYCHLMPGREPRLYDPLGNLNELSISEKSRNGHSLNVVLLQFLGGYVKLFEKQKLFCVWFFCAPVIVLAKAEAAAALLSESNMIEKSWFYSWIKPALGLGLITSGGDKWRSRRKLLNPCFHSDILKNYMTAMNKQSGILVERFRKETSKDFTDIVVPVSLCALDIICETVLGVHIGAQEGAVNKYSEFVESTYRAMELTVERIGNCLLWSDFIYGLTSKGREMKRYIQIGKDFTRSIIREKKERYLRGELKIGVNKRNSLMDVLMEHHLQDENFTEEDIREELITFTLAFRLSSEFRRQMVAQYHKFPVLTTNGSTIPYGNDTTATSVTWTLYLIGLHPNVQINVYEELFRTFGDDFERHATLEEVTNLKYLDCVIKEANRLYPAAPFFARDTSEDTDICGYPVPKGSTCLVMAYYLHRDEEVFPDAEVFDPNRFLPENTANRHHYAYVPFSAGPRNCIGQRFAMIQSKVMVSTILRNYSVECLDPRDKLLPTLAIHLKPSIPVRIRIRPRESTIL